MGKKVWTGWDIAKDGKTLILYFFVKKTGKLQWTAKLTFDAPVTEDQAYLEAIRYQMIENGELPPECVTKPLSEVLPFVQEKMKGDKDATI